MPTSANRGKLFTAHILKQISKTYPINEFLDIGPGMGTYALLYSGVFPKARWTGIEGWGPYFEEFQLAKLYNQLICADARWVNYAKLGNFDICFCGDILEHMSVPEAKELVGEL